MSTRHPTSFYPELSNDRLQTIAIALLDMRYATVQLMQSAYDDNYTRETAVFGRSKNMLVEMAKSGKHDWMSLKHAGMDVTFNIGAVPCRFFSDDPNSPEKSGFFKRNAVDDLFTPDDQQPVMWRFVVSKAMTEHDEDQVHFVGYNVFQEKISEWKYVGSHPVFHSVDQVTPATTEIPPADVDIRHDSLNESAEANLSHHKTA